MDSQSESRRQIVEKDFSPPLSDRGSFSRLLFCVRFWSSVCTYITVARQRLIHG